MKKILIIFLLTFNSLSAEEVTPLNFTDINHLLMDDNLTTSNIDFDAGFNDNCNDNFWQ